MRSKATAILLVIGLLIVSTLVTATAVATMSGSDRSDNGPSCRNATAANVTIDDIAIVAIEAYGYYSVDMCNISITISSDYPGGIVNSTFNLSVYDSNSRVISFEKNCSQEGITLEGTQVFNFTWTPTLSGEYHFNFSVNFNTQVKFSNVSYHFENILDMGSSTQGPVTMTTADLPASVPVDLSLTNHGNTAVTSLPYMIQVFNESTMGRMVTNVSYDLDLSASPLIPDGIYQFTYDWVPAAFGDYRLVLTYNWTDYNTSNDAAETTIHLAQAWNGNYSVNISGWVKDASGTGIAGCSVMINGTSFSVVSNETGHYAFTEIELSAGTHTLDLTVSGYLPGYGNITVSGNESIENVNITLKSVPASLGSISGYVLDASGVALSSIDVTLYLTGNSTSVDLVLTNATGGYTFVDLSAGTYRISVSAVGYLGVNVDGIVVTSSEVRVDNITLYALASIDVTFSVPDGEISVDPNEEYFTITFSQAIDATTVNSSTYYMTERGASRVPGSIDTSYNPDIDFLPDSPLAEGTWYDVTLTTDVRDINGTPFLASDFTTSFRTQGTEIALTMESPPNGGTDVSVNTPISITSTVPLNSSTVNTTTITLSSKDARVNINLTLNAEGTIITIIPNALLVESTTYEIVLDGLKTRAGDVVPYKIFSFTTLTSVTTGSVSGRLMNQTGDPLIGITVTLTNRDDTSQVKTATTNATGSFEFMDITPGNYTITIDAEGQDMTPLDITVNAGQNPQGQIAVTTAMVSAPGNSSEGLGRTAVIGLIVAGVIVAILLIIIVVLAIIMSMKKEDVDEDGGTVRRSSYDSQEWDAGAEDIDSSTFQCPNCGAYVDNEVSECPECGVEFEQDLFECPNCNTTLNSEAEECPECGYRFGEEEEEEGDEQYYDEEYDEEKDYDENVDVEVEEEEDYSYNTAYNDDDEDYDYDDDD